MTKSSKRLLIECCLLVGAGVSAIHAYVLSYRWIYETEAVRAIHVALWRAQLTLSVCAPLAIALCWNENYDVLAVCSAVFSLAMLSTSLEARRGTPEARADGIALACCLGAIAMLATALRVWRERNSTIVITRSADALGIVSSTSTSTPPPPPSDRSLVFLEGTSCLGKTTLARRSLDLLAYVRREPLYREKHSLPYVQALYDAELYADMALLLTVSEEEEKRDGVGEGTLYVDRSYVSQFCYAVIFAYDGAHAEPRRFAELVDREIFDDPAIAKALKRAALAWQRVAENRGVSATILWCVSDDPRRTAELTMRRADPYEMRLLFGDQAERARPDVASSHEARERRVLLAERYIRNQNHVFERTCSLLGQRCLKVRGSTGRTDIEASTSTADEASFPLLGVRLVRSAVA